MSYPLPEAAPVLVTITNGVPNPRIATLKENGNTKIQWRTSDPDKVYEIIPPPDLMEDGNGAVGCSLGVDSAVLKIKSGKASPTPYVYSIIPATEAEDPPEILVEN